MFNPSISLNEIIEKQNMPEHLYKYQSFYSADGVENTYWKENINGTFHLSLGNEFEDPYDARPTLNPENICRILENFIREGCNSDVFIEKYLVGLREKISKEYIQSIISNYRKEIRIGCFTTSFSNSKMWSKYANNETGFCIQYDTQKNNLFLHSTLPVLYSERLCDISIAIASSILLEGIKIAQKRSDEDMIQNFQNIYKKIIKSVIFQSL